MKTIERNCVTAGERRVRAISLNTAIAIAVSLSWIIFSLFLPGLTSSVFAEGSIGSVTRIHGQVSSVSVSAAGQIAKGSEIHMGDQITTGDGSLVELTMQDQTKITLGPKSELVIRTYIYQPAQSGRGILEINKGVFRVKAGSIASFAGQSLIVVTPQAVISVLETEFWGNLADQELEIVLLGGDGISVSNSAGSVELKDPNTSTSISSSSAPLTPFPSTGSQLTTVDTSISWP